MDGVKIQNQDNQGQQVHKIFEKIKYEEQFYFISFNVQTLSNDGLHFTIEVVL